MMNPVESTTIALVQSIVAPGYGLLITGRALDGLPDNFYGTADEQSGDYTYSVWFDDPGSEVMVEVESLGTFTAEFDRSVVPTLPAA